MAKRFGLTALFVVLTGLGAALSLKAAIGVGAWDALAQSLGYLSGIKVGTIGMIMNFSCVLGQIILLKKAFKWIQLIQIPLAIILGIVVNFFLYNVFDQWVINGYLFNLALLMVAYVLIAFSVSMIIMLGIVTFPLEGICIAVDAKTRFSFAKIRQFVDFAAVFTVLILTYFFTLPLTIREGTVIGMLIFGPLLGFFMKHIRNRLHWL